MTIKFSKLFASMENADIADRCNPYHVAAMHYILCPRINFALEQFRNTWNSHPLRTCQHRSPLMLWTVGRMGSSGGLTTTSAQDMDDNIVPDIQTDNDVQVPDVLLHIPEEHLQVLEASIDPVANDGNHGIDTFRHTVILLEQIS